MRFLVEQMGMGCYLWIGEPGFSVVRPIEAAAKAGLLVTVRIQPDGGEPHPRMQVDPASVRRGVDAGMTWLQLGNEPDSKGEWTRGDGGVQRGQLFVDALGNQLMDLANKAIAGGARVLIPPMNAGYPSYDRNGNVTDDGSDRVSHLNVLRWADRTGNLEQLKRWAADGWLGVAVHNRPSNHYPPEYPNDPVCLTDPDYFQNQPGWSRDPVIRLQNDGTSFDSYRNIDDLNVQFLGQSVPLFGTEAGYTIEVEEDSRYRKIKDDHDVVDPAHQLGHAVANLELFARFNPDHPKRHRPALLGLCMYHALYAGDSFVEAWWENKLLGRDLAIVTELPKWWREHASAFVDWPARWVGAAPPVDPGPAGPPPVGPPVVDPPPGPGNPPAVLPVSRKLGVHIISWAGSPALDLILETGPGLVKLMNNPDPEPIEKILAKWPATLIILRKYFDESVQNDFIRDGIDGGRRCAHAVVDHFAQVITVCRAHGVTPLVEGVNEPPLRPYDTAPAALAVYTEGFAGEVRALGFIPATLSLSVGQPEGDEATRQYIWDRLAPALAATMEGHDGAVAMHPYGRPPAMDAPDRAYYFKRAQYDRDHFWPALYRGLSMVFTESGLDAGTLEPPPPKEAAGWKSYVSPAEYARQLRWAVAEINRDPLILGMTPFTHGPTGDWNDFGCDGYEQIDAVYKEQAQEETMPPLQETKVDFDPIAPVKPGESLIVAGTISGIDGPHAQVTLYGRYPQRDDDTDWGQTNHVDFKQTNGRFSSSLTLGQPNFPFTEPLEGTAELAVLELTPGANPTPDNWGEYHPFTAKFVILPEGASQPANDGKDPAGVDFRAARIQLDAQWGWAQQVRAKGLTGEAEGIEQSVIALKEALRLQ